METQESGSAVANKNINKYNSLGIVMSSGLMAITLIISWVLWLTLFRTNIDEIIKILNKVISQKGIKFDLNFQILTFIVLGIATIILTIATVPFIIFKKWTIITFLLALLMLIIVIVLIGGSVLFCVFGYDAFLQYISNNNITKILFFILPWGLVIVYCLFCFGFCSSIIIAHFINKSQKQAQYQSLVPTNFNATSALGNQPLSPFTENTSTPIIIEEQKPQPQGINIVITNSTGFSQPNSASTPNTINLESQQLPPSTIPIEATNSSEIFWTREQIETVWNKGEIIANYNPHLYRKDYAGALMFKSSFVNHPHLNDDPKSYNWTIVYQRPLIHGGTTDINNLQPLNNANAVSKANNYPKWKTTISYNGKQNVLKTKSWKDK